ncbi:MAG: hypothetical protein JST61_03580 [Acidobacteria bacterium]|nr:hypothetical protein [Acidobacteriota bacterium]
MKASFDLFTTRKYQNTVTAQNVPRSLGFLYPLAVAWVWIRLAVGSCRDQTLGLRSDLP